VVIAKQYFKMTHSENKISGIKVLELRNYLLEPGLTERFSEYFHSKFVEPMKELNGYTLGEFAIDGVNDRFVWFRGFTDMNARLKFLNDFYLSSETWKKYGGGANEMMINSDNVYLLRPLKTDDFIISEKQVTVVDFYYCNGTLDKTINLFEQAYLPFLQTININDVTLWISEMTPNDFPRLPAFQDKNLLLTISNYSDKREYELKQSLVNDMPLNLKRSMLQLVTIHNNHTLLNLKYKNERQS
jgi:hypothetical protein